MKNFLAEPSPVMLQQRIPPFAQMGSARVRMRSTAESSTCAALASVMTSNSGPIG